MTDDSRIKPPATEPAIRMRMYPKDTNPDGDIFGGFILAMIDEAAAVEAQRQQPHRYVTISMDAVRFHKPVHVGDIVSLWTHTEAIGTTSVRIHVDVHANPHGRAEAVRVTEAKVTMVAVNTDGRPIPVLAEART